MIYLEVWNKEKWNILVKIYEFLWSNKKYYKEWRINGRVFNNYGISSIL